MICAACNENFQKAKKGDNVCPSCGHVMLRRKTKTESTLAASATRQSKFRKPSLPTFSILNDQEND